MRKWHMHGKIMKPLRGERFDNLGNRIGEKKKPRKNGKESWWKKKAAWEEKAAWEREKWELPKNGEILLIYKRKAELEAKRLLPWGKPSRYNYCELLISHLLHNDSLLFLTIFLGIDLLIGDPLYHVHYEASRDIGCIFFLFESVCDFSTSMSPLSDHEMWCTTILGCFPTAVYFNTWKILRDSHVTFGLAIRESL